jgi:hypothetical protein
MFMHLFRLLEFEISFFLKQLAKHVSEPELYLELGYGFNPPRKKYVAAC